MSYLILHLSQVIVFRSKLKILNGVSFHFCFQGSIQIDWDKLLEDFELFIQYQIKYVPWIST